MQGLEPNGQARATRHFDAAGTSKVVVGIALGIAGLMFVGLTLLTFYMMIVPSRPLNPSASVLLVVVTALFALCAYILFKCAERIVSGNTDRLLSPLEIRLFGTIFLIFFLVQAIYMISKSIELGLLELFSIFVLPVTAYLLFKAVKTTKRKSGI